jgi:hypothetical protein
MGEIKIVLSEQTEKLVEKLCGEMGIKKTEFVKGLVINYLGDLKK